MPNEMCTSHLLDNDIILMCVIGGNRYAAGGRFAREIESESNSQK